MKITLIIFAIIGFFNSSQPKCIKTMFGTACMEDEDCHSQQEYILYCNKTEQANTCAFNEQVYMGHVYENWDCPGENFAAVPWGSPVPQQLASSGLDCMRLCFHTKTCFGISVLGKSCYLKNDACFKEDSLVETPQAIIGLLRILNEDYRCGCHYPFERTRTDGSVLYWYPDCPGVLSMSNYSSAARYSCCSKKGLCKVC